MSGNFHLTINSTGHKQQADARSSLFWPTIFSPLIGRYTYQGLCTLLEGLFSIVTAIAEAIFALISALAEFIAGFFVAAGETLTLIDLGALLVVLLFEVVLWFILWLVELTVSLFKWRKPKLVKRPVLWRPKPKVKKSKDTA